MLHWQSVPALQIFSLMDKSLADFANLPEPDELPVEIIENLEAGLSSFREIVNLLSCGKE